MKCNLIALLNNIASDLEDAHGESAGGYGYALRELAGNLQELANNPEQWSEFADIYCLTKREQSESAA